MTAPPPHNCFDSHVPCLGWGINNGVKEGLLPVLFTASVSKAMVDDRTLACPGMEWNGNVLIDRSSVQ